MKHKKYAAMVMVAMLGAVMVHAADNRALILDGIGDFVLVPDSPETQLVATSLTVEAWVWLDKYNTNYNSTIVMKNSTTNGGWRLIVQGSGQLGFVLGGGSPSTPRLWGEGVVTTGTWHHLAAVYDCGTQSLKLYRDGSLDAETNGFPAVFADSADLRIGINNDETAGDVKGLVDDVRIWRKALDSTNLVQTMRTKLSGGEPDLVACLNFDDGTAADLTPFHNNGAFRGDAGTIPEDPLVAGIRYILDYLPVEIIEIAFPSGFPITRYQVQCSSNLMTTNWTDIGSSSFGNNRRQTFYEEATQFTQRFYRIDATY